MNLNHLKFVLAVAHTGSFTKASQKCCVTQPTLSNAIQHLESQLGGSLFNRSTRQVKLTAFGKHLLPSIQAVADAQQELKDNANLYLEPNHKLLTIGFSPLADMRMINAIVDPFSRLQTDVHTYFKECFLETMAERLNEEQVQLTIHPTIEHDNNNKRNHASMPLYREPVFVIPREDPQCLIRGQGPITVLEAYNEVFVLTPNICGHTHATREWFSKQGKTIKEYPGQALSYHVMQDWADLGLASAILPWSKITNEFRPRARQLFITDNEPAYINFELTWRTDIKYPPLTAFLSHCEDRLTRVIAGLYIQDELFQPVP